MRFRNYGFSITELVVAVAIMGVLLSLGLPAFSAYTNNVKLRVAAENFLAGIQVARGEAVKLNARVEFLLTNGAPVSDDGSDSNFPAIEDVNQLGRYPANRPTAAANGANWLVRAVSEVGSCNANSGSDQSLACWFISGKKGSEGAGVATATAISPVVIDSSGTNSIVFTALGDTSLSAPAIFKFSNPNGGACVPIPPATTPVGSMRCLWVTVSVGGRAKLCDPAANSPGDTRGC